MPLTNMYCGPKPDPYLVAHRLFGDVQAQGDVYGCAASGGDICVLIYGPRLYESKL